MTIKAEGFVQPKKIEFQSFAESLEKRSVSELKESIQRLRPFTEQDHQWYSYFQALIKLKEEADIDALNLFKKLYEESKQKLNHENAEDFRWLGLVLKKIGWIYRKNKDFEKAYFYHNARYLFMCQYGSEVEIHDSAISLDMDAYYLKDLRLSELWLKISLEVAAKIKNPIDQTRTLGISHNNLASTYSLQKRFKEATDSVYASLDAWINYEALTGPHENKVVWAYYGVGDIHESHALNRKESGQNFTQEKNDAIKAFQKSLELAEKRSLSETDRRSIQERLEKVSEADMDPSAAHA